MKQMAYHYFNPLFNSLLSIFKLKKGIVLVGFILTIGLEWVAKAHFLGFSVAIILVTSMAILYNTITGAIASHYVAKRCLENGNEVCWESKRFRGKKLMYVVFKFITFFMYLLIYKVVHDSFIGSDLFSTSFKIIGLLPVVLFLLYEYNSANKNIKKIYGKYPYLATPSMRIFDALEDKFDKMLSL